jgi:putative addiction module component (TIGR02574 family)
MSIAEIKQELGGLTNAERIELLNAIWESLDNKDEEFESPEWHREVLAERETKIQSGRAQLLRLDEVKKRFDH